MIFAGRPAHIRRYRPASVRERQRVWPMPCHAMPSHTIHAISCHPCHLMPSHTMLCHAIHLMPCHAMPYHAMPYHDMPQAWARVARPQVPAQLSSTDACYHPYPIPILSLSHPYPIPIPSLSHPYPIPRASRSCPVPSLPLSPHALSLTLSLPLSLSPPHPIPIPSLSHPYPTSLSPGVFLSWQAPPTVVNMNLRNTVANCWKHESQVLRSSPPSLPLPPNYAPTRLDTRRPVSRPLRAQHISRHLSKPC